MTKKSIFLVLLCLFLICIFAITPVAATGTTGDECEHNYFRDEISDFLYGSICYIEYRICNDCGYEVDNASIEHFFDDEGVCIYCGGSEGFKFALDSVILNGDSLYQNKISVNNKLFAGDFYLGEDETIVLLGWIASTKQVNCYILRVSDQFGDNRQIVLNNICSYEALSKEKIDSAHNSGIICDGNNLNGCYKLEIDLIEFTEVYEATLIAEYDDLEQVELLQFNVMYQSACSHLYTDGVCYICYHECPHEKYVNGECSRCLMSCTHEYVDGFCVTCGYAQNMNSGDCIHTEFDDGVCVRCGYICNHIFSGNGTCMICMSNCQHEFVGITCSVCGFTCTHNFEGGNCVVCGFTCSHETLIDVRCPVCRFCVNHEFDGNYCIDCGFSCVHEYVNSICSICGYVQNTNPDDCDHTFGTPIFYTNPDVSKSVCGFIETECTICGYISCAEIGHSFKYDTCTRCNYTASSAGNNTDIEPESDSGTKFNYEFDIEDILNSDIFKLDLGMLKYLIPAFFIILLIVFVVVLFI